MNNKKRKQREKRKKKEAAIKRAKEPRQTQEAKEVYQKLKKRIRNARSPLQAMTSYHDIVDSTQFKNSINKLVDSYEEEAP